MRELYPNPGDLPTPTELSDDDELRDAALMRMLDAVPAEPDDRPWRIGDPVRHGEQQLDEAEAAAWLLRKRTTAVEALADLEHRYARERDRVLAAIEPELQALDEWRDDAAAGDLRTLSWSDELLSEYALRARAEGTEAWPKGEASLSTPAGRIGTRLGAVKVELTEPDVFAQGVDVDDDVTAEGVERALVHHLLVLDRWDLIKVDWPALRKAARPIMLNERTELVDPKGTKPSGDVQLADVEGELHDVPALWAKRNDTTVQLP